MGLLAQKARGFLKPITILAAIVLFSGALAAYAGLKDLKSRASLFAGSLTGTTCLMASIGPCFPWGIKASHVTLSPTSGEPLFQARELRVQVNLLRYLRNNRNRSELFDTIRGDGIKLTLIRNENGEWDFPRLARSQGIPNSAQESTAPPRRFIFTNVTILVKTEKGVSERFYQSLEGEVDPACNTVRLKLSGANESARMTLVKSAVKHYELQAENFSPALLAAVSAFPLPLENLILNGNLKATTTDGKNFALEGSGTVTTQSLSFPLISSQTIDGLSLPFNLKGDLTSSGFENMAATISLAGETATIQGDIKGWEKPVLDVTTTFADFSYDRAISALPPSLHPDLPVISLSGSMTGTFNMHLDLADPESLDYSYTGRTDRLEILNLGREIDMERLKGPFIHKVRMNPETEVSILLSTDNPDFIPYRKIPFSLRSAVMAAEDLGFFSHRGFSKRHIRGSVIDNLKAGRVVRGASTISMQLAKNLFLSPERTLSRKLEEALITVALEQNLGKERILEIYLNIIEWGEGIYGIGPAARYYFGKRPAELSPVESAFLASIIARPRNWRPDPLSRLGQGWQGYLRVILGKMYEMGGADVDDLVGAGVSEARMERSKSSDQSTPFDSNICTEGCSSATPSFTWGELLPSM